MLDSLLPWQQDAHCELVPYACAAVPQIDIPTLTYFASSLLWRASVAVWRMAGDILISDLGPKYNRIATELSFRKMRNSA
jgi:hypothetical protein